MLWLIFQHLTSLKAFLPKHKDLLRVPDVHGRAAEKLLALSPICTAVTKPLFRNGITDESTPNKSSGTSSLPTFLVGFGKQPQEGLAMDAAHEAIPDPSGYQGYLVDARKAVRDRYEASQCWRYPYDGILPPSPDASASIGNFYVLKKIGKNSSNFVYIQATLRKTPFILTTFFHTNKKL